MKRLPASSRAHSGENMAQLRTTLLRALRLQKYSIYKDPEPSSSHPIRDKLHLG